MSAYDDMILAPRRATRRMCAEAFGIEEHRLVSASRVRDLVIARQATYYVLRARFPDFSFPQIGKLMGGRDHSTIIYGIAQITERMKRDPALRQVVAALIKGGLPVQHDAHVRRWQVEKTLSGRRRQLEQVAEAQAAPDPEGEEWDEPLRVFCDQCDRRMTIDAAARCQARICGLRARPALGQQGIAA